MHRFWETEEMVRLLAKDLEKRCGASASAVALACCSRQLVDIVLDSVWEEVRGLVRLMQCLPPDTWEIRDCEFIFIRRPSIKEWIRFSSYARRIHTFHLKSDLLGAPRVSWAALNMLSMRAPTLGHYPLPNLRFAYLEVDSWSRVPSLQLFLNPGLTSVCIGFPNAQPDLYRPALVALIPTEDLTHLQLNFMAGDDLPPLHTLLDEASETLRSVSLHGRLSTATIDKLLQLPHLRCLEVELPEARISPPAVVFPSLEKLGVVYEETGSWIHILQEIPLWELDVTFTGSSSAHLQTLGSSLLDSNAERTLTSLKCTSRNTIPLTEAGILPLLSFGKLTILDVTTSCDEGQCGAQLNDSIVSELATALPQLTSLGLGSIPCKASTPDVTVASLVALSTNCVDLDFLRIHFDAIDIVTRSTHGSSQVDKFTCKLHTLSVGSQPLPSNHDDILLVTSAILRIFPHLETISSTEGDWNQVKEGVEMFRKPPRINPLPTEN